MAAATTTLWRLAVLLTVVLAGVGSAAGEEDSFRSMKFQAQQVTPPGDFRPEVIGGKPVESGVYKEVVRITFQETAQGEPDTCTGVFLHGQGAVLTAGHCSCGILDSYRFVLKGTLDSATDAAKPAARYAIREPVRFPGYSCSPGAKNAGLDIAVFFVRNLDGLNIEPDKDKDGPLTRIASMHTVYTARARQLVVAGYGYTESGKLPTALMRAAVGIGSYFCSTGSFDGTSCVGFREFVLSTPGGDGPPRDTCGGDSGGPVYWYPPVQADTDKNSFLPTEALVGITSRGLAFAHNLPGMPCGGGGVYTAVGRSDVLDWLLSLGVTVRTTEVPIATTTGGQAVQ